MALYIMKTFDGQGRLIGRSEFQAGWDDEAVAALKYLRHDRSCELWCSGRKVADWTESSGENPRIPRRSLGF